MPAMFALVDRVIGNPTMSYFVAFGSFAMLLLVDFPGSIADRARAQAALGVACVALICLGTLASHPAALATAAMVVVAFVILFAGVVSSTLAGATTALLLAFILPVSLRAPVSEIPDRIAGWGLAAAVSVLAVTLLWPSPARNPIRDAAISACRALAAWLRAEVSYRTGSATREEHEAARARAEAAVERLQALFFATPYRPTGLATDARAVSRLVDELEWLNTLLLRSGPGTPPPPTPDLPVCRVKESAAELLDRAAALLDSSRRSNEELDPALRDLGAAREALERAATTGLPTGAGDEEHTRKIVSALDPSFRAQELSFVVAQIAATASFAAAAQRRSWLDRILGRQPAGFSGAFASLRGRAASHFRWSSSWLQNSLRGAAALGLAVFVADQSGVQHGFWVVFGTLAVLRSNALSTGQSIVRALVGTTAGFVVGGVLVYLVGTNTTVLWVLLPFVILIAGLAPAAISFAAGQAAFTATLLILFNILVPAGWKLGLVRIEDVAIGSAVSLAVGLMFWPRGAAHALGRALSEAYVVTAAYLADAVAYGVSRCDGAATHAPPPPPSEKSREATSATRRLDDTFRSYLSERGSKRLPLSEVTRLVNGVAGLRLAADAVLELWENDGARGGNRSAARRELTGAAARMTGWYDRFAASLVRAEDVPEPLAYDRVADGRLIDAVATDLRGSDGHATATGVRVIWTGDHLDAARRLEQVLVVPARAAVGAHALEAGELFPLMSRPAPRVATPTASGGSDQSR
jgi:uncharacterized membrane protein YccC